LAAGVLWLNFVMRLFVFYVGYCSILLATIYATLFVK